MFDFNTAKYYLNLIKPYLPPILVNEQDIEPSVIKKPNQFIWFQLSDNQLIDIENFLGQATSLGSLSKIYKTSETKRLSLRIFSST